MRAIKESKMHFLRNSVLAYFQNISINLKHITALNLLDIYLANSFTPLYRWQEIDRKYLYLKIAISVKNVKKTDFEFVTLNTKILANE